MTTEHFKQKADVVELACSWRLAQNALGEGVPTHGRGFNERVLRSLPTQTVLWKWRIWSNMEQFRKVADSSVSSMCHTGCQGEYEEQLRLMQSNLSSFSWPPAAGLTLVHDTISAFQMLLTPGCNDPRYHYPQKLHFGSWVSEASSGRESCCLIRLSVHPSSSLLCWSASCSSRMGTRTCPE